MFKWIRCAAAVATVAGLMPVSASASVLTFDDMPSGCGYFTSTYDGFNFGDNNCADNDWFYTQTDPDYPQFNAESGTGFASTVAPVDADGNPLEIPLQPTMPITSATDFIFDGAYFSGYDNIEYQLYLDGVLVYTSAESPDLTATPTYFASGYSGLVDSVVILGSQGYYAMDNFTYEAAVPEPGTAGLMLVGVAGLVAVRRKARKS